MVYGYIRVSTVGQMANTSIQEQEDIIKSKYPNAAIYKEAFTGKTTDRPVFNELLEVLKPGDILAVSKLYRYCRSVSEGLGVIDLLLPENISIHIMNIGLIDNSPLGRLLVTVLLSFAEFERSMIIERTQAGKEIAKTKPDFKDGRPKKFNIRQIKHALFLLETNSYKQVTEMTGISKSTLVRAKQLIK